MIEPADPSTETQTWRPDAADRPLTGVVGKYELYELIGAGAMGTVYRGVDQALGRDVAIKLMSPAVATDEDLRNRFHREAQTAGVLQHPNIITIFEFGEADGRLFIAMEYVEGRDLSRIIRNHEPMTLLEKLGVAIDVLGGLTYAHERGITHRDIKPGNIRLTRDGRAKIMDFGIAHLAESELTSTGMVLGTPSYMAPESLKGSPPSAQGDVYSVGALLYELITHHKPFDGATQQEVLYRVLSDEPLSLREIDPGIPPGVEAIVLRAMAKDPMERYQSTTELSDDLKAACVALHAGAGSTQLDVRALLPRGRINVLQVLAAGLAVILLSWGASHLPWGSGGATPALEADSRLGSVAARALGLPTAAPLYASVPAPPPSPGTSSPDTLLTSLRDAARARRVEVEAAGVPSSRLAPGDRRLVDADSLAREGRYSEAILALSAATALWNTSEREYRASQTRRARPTTTPTVRQPPPVVTPPPPPARDDPAEIGKVIRDLAAALESRRVAAVRSVYPNLSDREEQTWGRFFAATRELSMTISVTQLRSFGDSAAAVVQGTYTYVNADGQQRQPISFPASFIRRQGRWQINHLGSTGQAR